MIHLRLVIASWNFIHTGSLVQRPSLWLPGNVGRNQQIRNRKTCPGSSKSANLSGKQTNSEGYCGPRAPGEYSLWIMNTEILPVNWFNSDGSSLTKYHRSRCIIFYWFTVLSMLYWQQKSV